MTSIVLGLCLLLLAAATAGVMLRLIKGPSLLDRVLASDVLLSVVAAALAVEMVWQRHTDYLIIIVMIGLLGFIGSVAVARFIHPSRTSAAQDGPGTAVQGQPLSSPLPGSGRAPAGSAAGRRADEQESQVAAEETTWSAHAEPASTADHEVAGDRPVPTAEEADR